MATSLTLTVNGRAVEVEVDLSDGRAKVRIDDREYDAELQGTNRPGLYSLLVGGRSWEVFARDRTGGVEILIGNQVYDVAVGRRRLDDQPAETTGAWALISPMAGQVVEVRVAAGDSVESGQPLVVVESMKMNNEMTAARGGVVTEVQVAPGQRVERGAVMVRIAG